MNPGAIPQPLWPAVQLPSYQEGQFGHWLLQKATGMMPGYFTPDFQKGETVTLSKIGEDGKLTTWMSLTLMEQESHMPHIAAATGHVVVMGLGMGMYLYNIMQKPEVTKITVVEKDPLVFDLLVAASDFANWPGRDKVTVETADALTWTTDEPVDLLYADIWPTIGDENMEVDCATIINNVPAHQYGFWTQEAMFVQWCHAMGIPLPKVDDTTYADWVSETFGPIALVGENEDGYGILAMASQLIQLIPNFMREGQPTYAIKTTSIVGALLSKAIFIRQPALLQGV